MRLFPILRKPRPFFTVEEREHIVDAVKSAEKRTSGEIRVYIESKCPFMDAIDRAEQVFFKLEMQKTDNRNAVLIYAALKDRQLAVFGDAGIHNRVGDEYWNKLVKKMITDFNKENYAEGIRQCVLDIGEALHEHFPYDNDTDKNELPDDIVFGR
ncbi:MAG: TPM domain-containing protein [Bacteroidetes bacterium]|nr:TPM domain-containing protein [Bacteroidota bacterium]